MGINQMAKKNNDKTSLAKEIFMKYYGSHFHMEREGEYSYYKKFNVSKKQEHSWIEECQHELLLKIEKEDIVSSLFSHLSNLITRSNDIDCFRLLLFIVREKVSNSDTFSSIRMAEELLKISKYFLSIDNKINKVVSESKKVALSILRETTQKPITIASYYYKLGYLNDLLTDEKIKKRIRKLDHEWRFLTP